MLTLVHIGTLYQPCTLYSEFEQKIEDGAPANVPWKLIFRRTWWQSKVQIRTEIFFPCFFSWYDVSGKSTFQQRGNIKATKILIKDNKQQYG